MGTVQGLDKIMRNMSAAIKRIEGEATAGLNDVTQDLKGKSQRLAPIDTGDLRGSAYAHVEQTATGPVGEVGYGLPYAVVQHENLEFAHPRGGQAKYLEQPAKDNASRYVEHIRDRARKVTR